MDVGQAAKFGAIVTVAQLRFAYGDIILARRHATNVDRNRRTLPESPLRLIRRRREYIPVADVHLLPPRLRGIYVLYRHVSARTARRSRYEVVYVGMATTGGIRGRLRSHRRSKRDLWTHCSVFEVWDNIRDEEVAELEGLFRHLYQHDSAASALNKHRSFKAMKRVEPIELSAPRRQPKP